MEVAIGGGTILPRQQENSAWPAIVIMGRTNSPSACNPILPRRMANHRIDVNAVKEPVQWFCHVIGAVMDAVRR
jgi:hypothetical protein